MGTIASDFLLEKHFTKKAKYSAIFFVVGPFNRPRERGKGQNRENPEKSGKSQKRTEKPKSGWIDKSKLGTPPRRLAALEYHMRLDRKSRNRGH